MQTRLVIDEQGKKYNAIVPKESIIFPDLASDDDFEEVGIDGSSTPGVSSFKPPAKRRRDPSLPIFTCRKCRIFFSAGHMLHRHLKAEHRSFKVPLMLHVLIEKVRQQAEKSFALVTPSVSVPIQSSAVKPQLKQEEETEDEILEEQFEEVDDDNVEVKDDSEYMVSEDDGQNKVEGDMEYVVQQESETEFPGDDDTNPEEQSAEVYEEEDREEVLEGEIFLVDDPGLVDEGEVEVDPTEDPMEVGTEDVQVFSESDIPLVAPDDVPKEVMTVEVESERDPKDNMVENDDYKCAVVEIITEQNQRKVKMFGKVYYCAYCNQFECKSRAGMYTHISKTHKEWPLAVARREAARIHAAKMKGTNLNFVCFYCPFAASNRATLVTHSRRRHPGLLQPMPAQKKGPRIQPWQVGDERF